MRSSPSILLGLLAVYCLSISAADASLGISHHHHSQQRTAVRGGRRHNNNNNIGTRSLKNDKDDEGTPPQTTSDGVVSSAFGDNPNDDDENDEDDDDDEDDDGFSNLLEEEVAENGDSERPDDNDQQDDDQQNKDEYPADLVSFVKLPTILVEVGVAVDPTSRESRQSSSSSGRNNDAVLEMLMEIYFERLLTRSTMGSKYVTSELEAVVSRTTTAANTNTNSSSLLEFQIQGEAEYQGQPVPDTNAVKDRVKGFLYTSFGANDLATYLENNGIMGAQVNRIYVNDGLSTTSGGNEGDNGGDADSPSGNTATDSANANNNNDGSGGNSAGLIVGLILFFICVLACTVFLLTTQRERCQECLEWCITTSKKLCAACLAWCKETSSSIREKHQQNKGKRGGWQDFHEDGSDTAPDTTNKDVSAANDNDDSVESEGQTTVLRWFSSKFRRQPEKEKPSDVLQNIHVVVDSDHILKQQLQVVEQGDDNNKTAPVYRSFSTAKYSAATVPHSNHTKNKHYGGMTIHEKQQDTSPQKTVGTYVSDEEEIMSMEDPIVRYGSSSRAMRFSPKYSESPPKYSEPHPWKENGTEKRKPSQSRTIPPPPDEEESNLGALVEWTNYLNPCIVGNLPTFHYESEQLDDLVASIPRNKSLADDASEESPPRERRSRSGRSGSRHRSRSGSRRRRSSSRRRSRSGRSRSGNGRSRSGRSSGGNHQQSRHSTESRYHHSNREI